MQANPLYQGQGSQVKKTYNSAKDASESKLKQSVLAYSSHNYTDINPNKYFNIPSSPKQLVQRIYQQSLKRPNYRVNQHKTNRRIMALHPSPYQSKNTKFKTLRRQNLHRKQVMEIYSPVKYKVLAIFGWWSHIYSKFQPLR